MSYFAASWARADRDNLPLRRSRRMTQSPHVHVREQSLIITGNTGARSATRALAVRR
jgi:hypothetical protein